MVAEIESTRNMQPHISCLNNHILWNMLGVYGDFSCME